jgi:hypothetical protein
MSVQVRDEWWCPHDNVKHSLLELFGISRAVIQICASDYKLWYRNLEVYIGLFFSGVSKTPLGKRYHSTQVCQNIWPTCEVGLYLRLTSCRFLASSGPHSKLSVSFKCLRTIISTAKIWRFENPQKSIKYYVVILAKGVAKYNNSPFAVSKMP